MKQNLSKLTEEVFDALSVKFCKKHGVEFEDLPINKLYLSKSGFYITIEKERED